MNKTNSKVYKIAGTSILAAIIIVIQILATYFPTKPFAITLALIPIIVGSAIYDEKVGAILGGVFSVVVLSMCIFGADVGGAMVWNANPFLCILVVMLKGMGAGFFGGLVFKLVSKKNTILATVLAGIVAPIANTGIFIIGLMLFFQPTLNAWAGGTNVLYYVIFSLTGMNFIVELVVNMVAVPIIVRILKAIKIA